MKTNAKKILYRVVAWVIGAAILAGLGACTTQMNGEEAVSPTVVSTATDDPTSVPPPTSTPTLQPTMEETREIQPTPTEKPSPENVQRFPDPDLYRWALVADGLAQPVGLSVAGDGSNRLFIIEKPGRIQIIQDGQVLEDPFLDIQDRVGDGGGEQGLLGLAFHPNYEENGTFFVNYTDDDGNTVVSRFTLSEDENRADPTSEYQVLTFNQPYRNHNGGHLAFGPRGYLWISTGDGGSAGDPQDNAQNLDNLLGKLLRIDIDQEPYAIPEDNPFGDEIWAYGLRNPWRFRFDPATGALYIADVGQDKWEEIDYLPADAPGGTNFGWDFREGSHPYEGTSPADAELTDPVAEYNQDSGDCSVSGGAVYRGSLPAWQGVYLYGDYCTGVVRGLIKTEDGSWLSQILFDTDYPIPAISQDEEGEVYLLDIRGGVYRLSEK